MTDGIGEIIQARRPVTQYLVSHQTMTLGHQVAQVMFREVLHNHRCNSQTRSRNYGVLHLRGIRRNQLRYPTQPVVENIPGDSWNSFSQEPQYEAPIDQPIPKVPAFNLSPKIVGLIVGGLLLFLGLLFLVLNSIKVTPKQNVPQQPPAQTQGQQAQPSQPSNTTDVRLIFVPDSTPLDYSGEVFQTTGRVAAKLKYAVNNQVIYCLQISIAAGSSNETVNFFCNYATFTSVAKDELVMVKFQQVEDGFISVNEVTK